MVARIKVILIGRESYWNSVAFVRIDFMTLGWIIPKSIIFFTILIIILIWKIVRAVKNI